MSAISFAVAFLTTPRPTPYIDRTLESCFNDPNARRLQSVSLFTDTDDPTYLDVVKDRYGVGVFPLAPEKAVTVRAMPVHTRFNMNYLRCLSAGDMQQGVAVFEDDVVFRPDWVRCLSDAVDEMSSHDLNQYALACYAPGGTPSSDLFDSSLRRGRYYCSYVADCFYGTQGMYYSQQTLPSVIDWFSARAFVPQHLPGDIILNQYFCHAQNLYATARSLVQHVGVNSTGLGTMHRSATFSLPWPTA